SMAMDVSTRMKERVSSEKKVKMYSATSTTAAIPPYLIQEEFFIKRYSLVVGVNVRVQGPHIGQVTVAFGVVKAVADDKFIRDIKAHVVQVNIGGNYLRLAQQGNNFQGLRVTAFEVAQQPGQGQAGVDDVFDDQHIAAFNFTVQVFKDAHYTGRAGGVAIRRHSHKFNLGRNRQCPSKIREEINCAFEHAD